MMNDIYEHAIKPMLPKKFDENEWFVIVVTIIVLTGIYYITMKNRHLLWTELISIFLFNLQLATLGDYFLAMPPYDFYDTVDRNSGELMDIFLQNIIYPGTVLFLMSFYNKKTTNKVLFILVSAAILGILEWIGIHLFHLFKYNTWKFYYSVAFYLLVMSLNVLFFDKLRKFLNSRLSNS
ncbi:CBO0543 family protein [Bacillus suaedaesalsae]|uniref:Uncharacterized protein n=1 Tax=Bacillus suaedaesalsae TaxID=2810349 RepID=A0ABS2DGK0_9BACI|nr:CBO0543 family protein [Bacillus suaedaesalsae]MBM6616678.1 hypothetical protein [Bacillus suaedaesalsae]